LYIHLAVRLRHFTLTDDERFIALFKRLLSFFHVLNHSTHTFNGQHPTTQFFTGRVACLPPDQQRQSTGGKHFNVLKRFLANVLH